MEKQYNQSYERGKGLVFSLCNYRFGSLNEDEEFLEEGGRIRDGAERDISIIAACFNASYFDHFFFGV